MHLRRTERVDHFVVLHFDTLHGCHTHGILETIAIHIGHHRIVKGGPGVVGVLQQSIFEPNSAEVPCAVVVEKIMGSVSVEVCDVCPLILLLLQIYGREGLVRKAPR